MTSPIQPPSSPTRLPPIVGPDEIGPRNEDEQYVYAKVLEALEGPPPEVIDLDQLEAELRAHIVECARTGRRRS